MTNGSYRWALPSTIEVPPDRLKLRLDIYQETILMHILDDGKTETRAISALDVSRAFTRETWPSLAAYCPRAPCGGALAPRAPRWPCGGRPACGG